MTCVVCGGPRPITKRKTCSRRCLGYLISQAAQRTQARLHAVRRVEARQERAARIAEQERRLEAARVAREAARLRAERERLERERQVRIEAERREAERRERLRQELLAAERAALEKATASKARGAFRPQHPLAACDAAARVVRDYAGLPLTADDVADLTGMGVNKTRQTLGLLVAGGVLATRRIEGNVAVWYDHHAMRDAA